MKVPSGSTDRYLYFVAVDATDLKTRETGLATWTVYRSRNGGAAAAYTTPTVNETDATNMPGVYELLLDEDTTLDAGHDEEEYVVHITHAGMAPVTRAVELYRVKVTEGQAVAAANSCLDANVERWNATAVPAEHTAGYPVVTVKDGTGTGEINTNAGAVALVDAVTTVNGLAAGAVTAAAIATGAIDADALAADAATEIADAVLSRNVSNVEATMPEHCLGTIVLLALEWDAATTPGSLLIKGTDGTTTRFTKTPTTSGTAELVTKLT